MPRRRAVNSDELAPVRPLMSVQAREEQIAGYALDCAERQIREGTASPSVLVHFLRATSTKEALERQLLEQQNELLRVKRESAELQMQSESKYNEALQAFRGYSGTSEEPEFFPEGGYFIP